LGRYRYLPRIFRAWIATSQLAPKAIEAGDWVAVQEAWVRIEDARYTYFGQMYHTQQHQH